MTPFIRDFTAGAAYSTLAALFDVDEGNDPDTTTSIGFNGILTAHQDNTATLEIRNGTVESSLVPGEWFELRGVDIANVEIKGNGLVLKVQGSTSLGW